MSNVSRRDWIGGALAAGAVCADRALGASRRSRQHVQGEVRKPHHKHALVGGTEPDSLNVLARTKGLRFGSCIGTGPSGAPGSQTPENVRRAASFDDPRMRALFIAQCGILVPENELKWYALRPKPTGFDFRRADILIDYATKHRLPVRGHTLLWNRTKWLPPWLASHDFGVNPAGEAERMLREHIATVCGRYGERIFTYDVINETIAPQTGELEDSVFTRYLGPNVVDICFHAAREAAPHAQLVYNDYMDWRPASATHRAAVLKLIERMKANGVPIDALGIQSHIGPDNDTAAFVQANEAEWRKFLDQVTALGIDLVVTEFDVNDKDVTGDLAARDRAVADCGKAFLNIALSYPQTRYVMAWGIVDKYSWLQNTSARPDGLPKRPCPYDADFEPKPLRDAMMEALAAAPVRPELTMKPA